MIILTAAMPFETAWISSQLLYPRHILLGKFTALQGSLHGSQVLIFHLGVGKTNAAHGATLLLEKYYPRLMLLIGCGGAYRGSGLQPGDLAIANKEIFGEEGVVTSQGWRSTHFLNLPLLRKGDRAYYNAFEMDQTVLNRAISILQKFNPKIGPFITISEVSGTQARAEEMEQRFHGICENMEGAAVAQLCTLYEVPFLEIRGISNLVKERNRDEWDLASAANVCQQAALALATQWGGNL
ncbi:MAG: futalosine hydrolase [bacterium]